MQADTTEAEVRRRLRPLLRHDPLAAGSRKISARGVSDRRILLTFPRGALLAPDEPAPLAHLVGGALPQELADSWHLADMLHVGVDGAEDGGAVRKLYLEFAPECAPQPDLVYLALKCGGGRQALHRYVRTAAAPVLAALDLPPALAEPARRLAALSQDLLHVSEPGSARLSLDIGLADLDPDSRLWAPLVARLVAAINPAVPLPSVMPSHVALGRDRQGAPFVTLYGWPEES